MLFAKNIYLFAFGRQFHVCKSLVKNNPLVFLQQHNSDNASKVVHKLHQLEVGQRKIIQLLTSIEKELSAREKLCCSKHYLQHQQAMLHSF
jgi:hypothetical protein